MEELPTLGEFKALLHDDPIFGDYFNAFLNLPVSCYDWRGHIQSYSRPFPVSDARPLVLRIYLNLHGWGSSTCHVVA